MTRKERAATRAFLRRIHRKPPIVCDACLEACRYAIHHPYYDGYRCRHRERLVGSVWRNGVLVNPR